MGGSDFQDSNGLEVTKIHWTAGFPFDLDKSGPEPSLRISVAADQAPEQADNTEQDHETTKVLPVDRSRACEETHLRSQQDEATYDPNQSRDRHVHTQRLHSGKASLNRIE